MLRVALGFFIAAIFAGVLGFGGWAGTFTGIAILAFYIFIALTILSLLAGALSGVGHTPSGAMSMLVVAALFGAGVYWWLDSDMNAQKLGRSIDRTAFEFKEGAGSVVKTASGETAHLVGKVADDAGEAADRTADKAKRETEDRNR